MKKVIILLLVITGDLFACENVLQPDLPLNNETEHFKFYCNPADKEAAEQLLNVAEKNFQDLSTKFDHEYSTKITIYMFASIQELHSAIGCPAAQDWLINSTPEKMPHSLFTVSPNNPGTCHTTKSCLTLNLVSLTRLFVEDKYKNKMPKWFLLGVCLNMAEWVNKSFLQKMAKDHSLIPTFEQLENLNPPLEKPESRRITQNSAYSMVEFIRSKFGWNKVLELLSDFSSFEKILGVTQDRFREQWIEFLDEIYGKKIDY